MEIGGSPSTATPTRNQVFTNSPPPLLSLVSDLLVAWFRSLLQILAASCHGRNVRFHEVVYPQRSIRRSLRLVKIHSNGADILSHAMQRKEALSSGRLPATQKGDPLDDFARRGLSKSPSISNLDNEEIRERLLGLGFVDVDEKTCNAIKNLEITKAYGNQA
ncbi:hypothetical protein Cni_G01516 [Canna indica]|uniref:Uncharacterized protein n=1 Tax=Canna indica TaxID=4628 RepID=A0AAQ3JMN2_9LILI|nr:hypothetical protein Cni_G01516 [Canna indica]